MRQKKIIILDFDGTVYSGEDKFKYLPEFLDLHRREILGRVTDNQYNLICKENPKWLDVTAGIDIIDEIYKLKGKYPRFKISARDFYNWQRVTRYPIVIDKNLVMDVNFLEKICGEYPVYIVSNSSPEHIKFYMHQLGINPKWFAKIVSNRFTVKDRTKKHYYKSILGKEKVAPTDAIVIGDSKRGDLEPAEMLGIPTAYTDDARQVKGIIEKFIKGRNKYE